MTFFSSLSLPLQIVFFLFTVLHSTLVQTSTTMQNYREKLNTTQRVHAVLFRPIEQAGTVIKAFRGLMMVHRGVRNVNSVYLDPTSRQVLESGNTEGSTLEVKQILLDPSMWPVKDDEASGVGNGLKVVDECAGDPVLPPTVASVVEALKGSGILMCFTVADVHLSYKNYTMPEILKTILQEDSANKDLVALSGFEEVGHIAHVNLSKAHLPFKYTIGDIIVDCNPSVGVVVNKVASISSVFREFPLEIIAVSEAYRKQYSITEIDSITQEVMNQLLTASVKQHGCTFLVPYNRVYWNSRLSHEHTSLVETFQSHDTLFDVMAGVGPFAIPAAQNGVMTYCNDLNPVAAEYMSINRDQNKIKSTSMIVFNMDGRDFLNSIVFDHCVKPFSEQSTSSSTKGRKHVVMNLPAIAVEFLDVFHPEKGTKWRTIPEGSSVDKGVLFHVYCFSSDLKDILKDAVKQVEHNLGYVLATENVEGVVLVRDVAPQKRMVRVDFTLPEVFWTDVKASSGSQRFPKQHRAEA